jgi:hypothetical protein
MAKKTVKKASKPAKIIIPGTSPEFVKDLDVDSKLLSSSLPVYHIPIVSKNFKVVASVRGHKAIKIVKLHEIINGIEDNKHFMELFFEPEEQVNLEVGQVYTIQICK